MHSIVQTCKEIWSHVKMCNCQIIEAMCKGQSCWRRSHMTLNTKWTQRCQSAHKHTWTCCTVHACTHSPVSMSHSFTWPLRSPVTNKRGCSGTGIVFTNRRPGANVRNNWPLNRWRTWVFDTSKSPTTAKLWLRNTHGTVRTRIHVLKERSPTR
jgi:hypothetical protein